MRKLISLLITLALIFSLSTVSLADTVSYSQNGYTLMVNNLDSSFSATTKQKMVDTFFKVYPVMAARFNPNAAKNVTFTIDPNYGGVAATSGTNVVFSSNWLKSNPNDTDTVTHEAFHIVQAYNGSSIPGWATEGLADYARYRYGTNNPAAGWSLPNYASGQSYTDAYRVTARFFAWLELKYSPAVLENLNLKGRTNSYSSGLWAIWTGKTVDQLWADYAANSALTGGGATFYENADYTGGWSALPLGSYSLFQLNAAGIPNDWMSSLKVSNGYTVEVYADDNFGGTKWTFTGNSNYVGADCNDKMSSVKILAALFYKDLDYGGGGVALSKGNYTLAQLNAAGLPDNWMSSLTVPSGWTVEVYQNDNFTGTKWTFTGNSNYVGADCNDQMTSVRIY